MPPFGFRKRERSSSPAPPKSKTSTPKRAKPTLFDTADAPKEKQKSLEENKKFLEELGGDEDDPSSLSDVESDEFEDVPPAKRRKITPSRPDDDEEDEEDDEMEWENAIQPEASSHATPSKSMLEPEIGDVSISINDDGTYVEPLVSAATGKKAPSKRERQVRVQTHCLHVQALMWHNTIRNSWLNDKDVQKMLTDGLPEGVRREVRKWKDAMSAIGGGSVKKTEQTAHQPKGKRGKKGKDKSAGRDWNAAAEHLEPGVHGGDPLLRLLKVLTAYWRKRFIVTAPGLRKEGYKQLKRLRDEVRAWEKGDKDSEEYGERVQSLKDFRKLAKKCEGSRDVGAQLFVALLRGLGLETRMVANLQPIGFGWSKAEEADPKKKTNEKAQDIESDSDDEVKVKATSAKPSSSTKKVKTTGKAAKPARRSSRGQKANPINLDDSDSPLSSAPSEPDDAGTEDDDDVSITDITPSTPRKKPAKKYDRDMAYPNYWTEVCSPVSHKYYPVDPIVLSTIASNEDLLQTFEPRGKKSEKAKQVMCYTIGFSSDGTAKDVTVRYLKRHQLPGKTKGMRLPAEKVPIYNLKGKVKRYEDFDWFRTLMSVYDRPESKRTTADDLEEQTDLKPYKPDKEDKKEVAKESLQGYKQSADYVLEQHLRREEALVPGAEPVKYFTSGKGDKAQELPVYRREDTVTCKTVESWHKEGREIKIGEQPMKYVPMRAVTLVRKREMEDARRETGEKLQQGLYSEAQTDWIIPPPIQNGVIPKNAFGNIDVYVPTMVPRGAIHLPLKGSAKLCKKLDISFAEACTGFEFGKQRAVPVLTGVVVAQENAGMVRDAWRADQEEIRRKADTKRTETALRWWRKMVLGLRVLERMRTEYADGGVGDGEMNPFVRKAKRDDGASESAHARPNMDVGGGFFPPDYEEDEPAEQDGIAEAPEDDMAGGFLVDDENVDPAAGGGFLVEDETDMDTDPPPKNRAPITPVSLQSMHKAKGGATGSDVEVLDANAEAPMKSTKLSNGTRKPRQSNVSAAKSRKAEGKRKAATPSEEEQEESSLSEWSSADNDDSQVNSNAVLTAPSSKNRKPASPKVVINGSASRPRAAKKVTPVRSQYFNHSNEGSDSEDESEAESEPEVIKPTKTTARTRARR